MIYYSKYSDMKKIFYAGIASLVTILSCENNNEPENHTVTIEMGSDHSKDVYYDLGSATQIARERSGWDLSFSVPLQTASIRINEGAGVLLYSAGDTTAWNSVDTTGIASRTPVYNNNSDLMAGAFNRYAQGGFNFGWGTYDHGGSYSVWGDSIYIIRLTNGDYKKLFIRKRLGYSDTYQLRWADIDGSNQFDESFSPSQYDSKQFIQYSLVDRQVVESEPGTESWDILFTRYLVKIPAGPGILIDYPVIGVLLRPGLSAVKVENVNPENATYSQATGNFSANADLIGWDWKVSDPVTHEISVAPNTSYFIKVSDTEIYRIYFTDYNSENNGSITFKTHKAE